MVIRMWLIWKVIRVHQEQKQSFIIRLKRIEGQVQGVQIVIA